MVAEAPAHGPVPVPVPPRAWNRCMALLRRCSTERHLRAAHALFVSGGLHRHPFALSRLILAACSLRPPALAYASLLFHRSPSPPNSFMHNALIRAHARGPDPAAALSFFRLLLRAPPASAAADHHSFPFALAACGASGSLATGAQIHALVVKNGLFSADHYVQTAVLRLYCNATDEAAKVFDEISVRDAVHYDVLMNAFIRAGLPSEALRLFDHLLISRIEPDEFAATTALTACAHAGALKQGVRIHKLVEGKGPSFLWDTFLGSALVSMYAKCGCIKDAVDVFNAMPERNTHMWATMIGAYAMHGFSKEAMACLRRMQEEDGLRPDGIVLLGALAACVHAGLVEDGLQLLAEMEARHSVIPEHEHYSCAVDMLCRAGRLDEALHLVREMPMRPLASVWGSLLTGCRIHGNTELAEVAVAELQSFAAGDGDDEGVYVQLSNIYLNADRKEDARRIRKLIGSRGIKKTPACSAIEVDGNVSSFVAGDQVHPQRLEICLMLEVLADHMRPCSEDEL
ncbi:putative pentatricopeptide repeat-containing protein At3g28640 [Musa acuminata AAA Group]|uniref:putative pentatricopeptide repeat-containing protein At3g28640 n=1 Tax=Musa acuminata AAA Group TaxID=214697 RepID=UPI0031DEFD52